MSLFENYQHLMADAAFNLAGKPLHEDLLLSCEGSLQTFYAPFDHINAQARIVICGITPGLQQAMNALNEARRQLIKGASVAEAKQAAKETASFSGPMRPNLIAMLDHIGVQGYLGIDSCEQLFNSHRHWAHYTSALRYPVFLNGENYSGNPGLLSRDSLRHQIENHLSEEIRQLPPHCVYVPLGPKVGEVFDYLLGRGLLRPEQVLNGLPHPSGANAERISYFLGRKEKAALSVKTNAASLDAAREQLTQKVRQLRS
ncbi:hypothetical protein [Pseudomonas sp. MAG733B]|uniref:hypothetical protein n=1 Tax=Pseudomonas sp. MAG733B TaxID=3122079 RepID=UPI0030D4EC2C